VIFRYDSRGQAALAVTAIDLFLPNEKLEAREADLLFADRVA